MDRDVMTYNQTANELLKYYGIDCVERITSQYGCEYSGDFWGFLNIYVQAAKLARPKQTIIDFGCYLAFQAGLFKDFKKYIGVDTVSMQRFNPPNAEHYIMTIQDYIKTHPANDDCFAICSYVEDRDARELVKATYDHCLVYYPKEPICERV